MPKQLRADKVGEHRTAYDKNRKRILAAGGVCGICGRPVDMSLKYPHPLSATVDHIIRISKGGHPSDYENLQLAHRTCNREKSDKLIDYRVKFKTEEGQVSNEDLPLSFNWPVYKAT